MRITCSLLQLSVALGGAGLNWYLFGWQPVAITTATGVIYQAGQRVPTGERER